MAAQMTSLFGNKADISKYLHFRFGPQLWIGIIGILIVTTFTCLS